MPHLDVCRVLAVGPKAEALHSQIEEKQTLYKTKDGTNQQDRRKKNGRWSQTNWQEETKTGNLKQRVTKEDFTYTIKQKATEPEAWTMKKVTMWSEC